MITIGGATLCCIALIACRYGRAGVQRLASLELRGVSLIVAAAGLQAALVSSLLPAFWCTLGSTVLVAVFGVLNRRTPGLPLAVGGALLNLLVMLAHNGYMPVHPASSALLGGTVLAPGTLLEGTKGVIGSAHGLIPLLGDWLPLPGLVTGWALWSGGDLLLLAGVCILLIQTMKGTAAHASTH